ncbi:dTDP-4-amino-4,6-dideoxygalactose transaminase [Metabacillus halosaccharovorans]|uniref:dTDP-4-amino-4,6-dideoxygalactose transaminase n=1 Tax=Metabacillus halosaccharovorans TaxID=930124 RepID=A0ABT3DC81_9BACI|nr:dTDP-4-amino-4,6-dideoxygalactose transaminase [Metabacillus halosaccharovorans]MCV9884668.1 dTDP-4-amino-4,6-dideoxygalactose transaminase [Metabacillus halosaccharovorans]
MIQFNVPLYVEKEMEYIQKVIINQKISGDGEFTKKCHEWLERNFYIKKALLTTSCTHALEMAALLLDIKEGDEVIMPAFTFVSTANAFVLRGAKIVFVDIRPDTMNIDETKIEAAITNKTKVVVPVHYAGVACEMDKIMEIANRYNLFVVEDAAQGVMSKYNGKALGTIGHFGTYSFHETKNYTCGEGGALLINDDRFVERAEILREKGTNRSRFLRGQVDKYSWVDIGSSYLPSELNAAMLLAQLEYSDNVNQYRKELWEYYDRLLKNSSIQLPVVPIECDHNAHMFYIKTKCINERSALIEYLRENNVISSFHYVPLHSSKAGMLFSSFHGVDENTTKESERLLRLPLHYSLSKQEVETVCELINCFYKEEQK